MATKKQFKIGDKWYVNEAAFRTAIRQIEGAIPYINNFSVVYSELSLGPLSDQGLFAAINNGVDGIIQRYEAAEIAKLPTPALQSALLPYIKEKRKYLDSKLKPILDNHYSILRRTISQPFYWSDI